MDVGQHANWRTALTQNSKQDVKRRIKKVAVLGPQASISAPLQDSGAPHHFPGRCGLPWAREGRVRGQEVSWPAKNLVFLCCMHSSFASRSLRTNNRHDFKGWNENRRIMLHHHTWFLISGPVENSSVSSAFC